MASAAAVNRSEIEKIVRKVVHEQQQDNGRATLKAIKDVADILTEDVIPNLPDRESDGDGAETGDDDDSGKAPMAFGTRAVSRGGGRDTDESDESADPDSDGDDGSTNIPQAVLEAYDTLSQSLTAEQADALSAFFAALSQELEGGDEDAPDSDDDATEDEDTEAFGASLG